MSDLARVDKLDVTTEPNATDSLLEASVSMHAHAHMHSHAIVSSPGQGPVHRGPLVEGETHKHGC